MEDPIEDLRIPEEALERLQQPDLIREYLLEGRTLQDILGFSEEVMGHFYGCAYNLFQEGRHQEAQDAFVFLTTSNPYVFTYWLGLGMSYQFCEEFEQALTAYECAAALDTENPQPYYHMACCYVLLADTKHAVMSLELAKDKAEGKSEYADMLQRVSKLEERVKKS